MKLSRGRSRRKRDVIETRKDLQRLCKDSDSIRATIERVSRLKRDFLPLFSSLLSGIAFDTR